MDRPLLAHLDRALQPLGPWGIGITALLLIVLLGFIDVVTGPEISFSIFYVLPVSLATWYVGFALGSGVALVSAATWLAADLGAGAIYSSPITPYWNSSRSAPIRIHSLGCSTAIRSCRCSGTSSSELGDTAIPSPSRIWISMTSRQSTIDWGTLRAIGSSATSGTRWALPFEGPIGSAGSAVMSSRSFCRRQMSSPRTERSSRSTRRS
jgi:hypothetical protein